MKKKDASWVSYEKDEVEALVAKMAKEGTGPAKIGLILRDQYGIPDVRQFDVKIGKIVQEETNPEVPADLHSLLSQAVSVHAHMAGNKKDKNGRHALDNIESKVRRLGKYYIRKKRLPSDWKYSLQKAKLIVK